MVVCVLYPRFELLAAVGDRRAILAEPVALAPEAGREQVVGEVSAAAEAFGVGPGMRVGEALARCPELRLAPPDPEGVRALWC
jgi:protein ImuB